MTQEDKELLFKDLCARLPYGVKCEVYDRIGVLDEIFFCIVTIIILATMFIPVFWH